MTVGTLNVNRRKGVHVGSVGLPPQHALRGHWFEARTGTGLFRRGTFLSKEGNPKREEVYAVSLLTYSANFVQIVVA